MMKQITLQDVVDEVLIESNKKDAQLLSVFLSRAETRFLGDDLS